MLCESNQIVFQFFQLLSLAFNFCLCHDLIMTLKNPFYPGKRRMKFYIIFSVLVVAVLTFFTRSNLDSQCKIEGMTPGHDLSPSGSLFSVSTTK